VVEPRVLEPPILGVCQPACDYHHSRQSPDPVILRSMTCVFCRACGVEESLLPPNFKCANEKLFRLHYGQPVGNPIHRRYQPPENRLFQHKEHMSAGFTSKYHVDRLLYWESFEDVLTAIDHEKQLKGWRRSKKIALSECLNPHWLDLSRGWYSQMKDGGASRDASTPSARSQATGLPTLSMTPRRENNPNPASLCWLRTSPRHSVRNRRIPTPA
jgi:putative endonuclease